MHLHMDKVRTLIEQLSQKAIFCLGDAGMGHCGHSFEGWLLLCFLSEHDNNFCLKAVSTWLDHSVVKLSKVLA